MSSLERARALHEEIERYQAAVVALLKEPPRTHSQTVRQGHIVRAFLERICACGTALAAIYDDRDGQRREELAATTGPGLTVFQLFYNRLRETREHHRSAAASLSYSAADALADPPPGPGEGEYGAPDARFSGPESFGRYLDLASLYEQWCNVDKAHRGSTDYLAWLGALAMEGGSGGCLDPRQVMSVPPMSREDEQRDERMRAFLVAMRLYLTDFFRRAQPLVDIDGKIAALERDFETLWSTGTFALDDSNSQRTTSTTTTAPMVEGDDSARDGVAAVTTVHCSLCRRDFAKQSVFEHHVLSRGHKQRAERAVAAVAGPWGEVRHRALKDAFVARGLCEVLRMVVRDTKDHICRKQARNPREIDEEAFAEATDMEDAELLDLVAGSDEPPPEEVKQTIDNYPTGWDGRPIPYWLYKLHGLGVEFRCNICGGMSYWGRRAFERHFQEWRHSHGMALLGIPNTTAFFEITEIDDAVALWRKIQADRATMEWKPDAGEECEDSDGNVYSRKLFDALVRQGIITPKKK